MQKRILTVARGDSRELRRFLRERLEISEEQAAALILEGTVWRGGRRVPSEALQTPPRLVTGERLTIYVDSSRNGVVDVKLAAQPEVRVIFEDDHILVVDKPAGLDSQPGRRGGPSLLSLLPAPLHLVHRLDAEASGLMVLARNRATAAALQEALCRGAIERQYVAVVDGVPRPSEGRIDLRIGRAPKKSPRPTSPQQKAHPTQSPYGQPATTHYRLVTMTTLSTMTTTPPPPELAGTSLLWLRLETGRTHQIRVHLSAIGHPIVGDRLYGGRPGSRLLLHASRLCLYPGKGGTLPRVFSSPPPGCFGGGAQASQPATEA
jgi:23S rRNA pseudouridine1911/1915/1917 synthase